MHVLLCVLHLDIALKKVLTLIWIPKKIEFELAPETTFADSKQLLYVLNS